MNEWKPFMYASSSALRRGVGVWQNESSWLTSWEILTIFPWLPVSELSLTLVRPLYSLPIKELWTTLDYPLWSTRAFFRIIKSSFARLSTSPCSGGGCPGDCCLGVVGPDFVVHSQLYEWLAPFEDLSVVAIRLLAHFSVPPFDLPSFFWDLLVHLACCFLKPKSKVTNLDSYRIVQVEGETRKLLI